MTNKDLIYVIEQIGREKGIGKEVLFEAVESALLSASKKTMGLADNVRMELDRHTGSLRVFARKKVVEAVTDAKLEIGLEEARKLNGEAELEDELEMELPPQEFGRIAAQTAKQVILQRVRDAERDAVYSEFIDKEGKIVRGVVHRVEKRNVIVEIGKAEAVLMEREQIPGERYNPSDRIRAYVLEVKKGIKGPQILLSRTHPGFLVRLFETEIPEIAEGIVQVREAAREGESAPRSPWRRPSATWIRSAPAWACAARASRSSAGSCGARRSTSSSGRRMPRRSSRGLCLRPRSAR
jgi:N utilization substance protein A